MDSTLKQSVTFLRVPPLPFPPKDHQYCTTVSCLWACIGTRQAARVRRVGGGGGGVGGGMTRGHNPYAQHTPLPHYTYYIT
jgi:hypothetical protein